MANRENLREWVHSAIKHHGGRATIVQVAEYIWSNHEAELRRSGELFYTWQYDMRWAAQKLRDTKILSNVKSVERGIWAITT
jgi:hypothetical protein